MSLQWVLNKHYRYNRFLHIFLRTSFEKIHIMSLLFFAIMVRYLWELLISLFVLLIGINCVSHKKFFQTVLTDKSNVTIKKRCIVSINVPFVRAKNTITSFFKSFVRASMNWYAFKYETFIRMYISLNEHRYRPVIEY